MATARKNAPTAPVPGQLTTDADTVEPTNDVALEAAVAADATAASASAKRRHTLTSNASLDIDFSAGRDAEDLVVAAVQERFLWARKISALREGVVAGLGKADEFYRIGQFNTPSGARTVIKGLEDDPDKLPCVVDLKAVKTAGSGGKKGSELWAMIPADTLDDSDEVATA